MKHGLSSKQIQEIRSVISSIPEIEEALIFGSRAVGKNKDSSDVDIAIKGRDAGISIAAKLKGRLEQETYLPFMFDVVAYKAVGSQEIIREIDEYGESIFRREG